MGQSTNDPIILGVCKRHRDSEIRVQGLMIEGRAKVSVREYTRKGDRKWHASQTALHIWEEQIPDLIAALRNAAITLASD